MTNDLAKNSLFFDYLYSLRVLEPGVRNETGELNDECISYTEKLQGFRKIIDEFIGIAGRIVGDVKQEKNWAIAAQNQLKSITKQRDAVEQEIQNDISEKTTRLEQIKVKLQHLQRIETNQLEVIENLYDNQ